MRSKQSGFTLVEIAIVLVIIGLLLGGVLKGQELINSAKIKNVANDLNGIVAGVYAYQDRYKTFPGDDAGAHTRWSTATSGNGDGVVGTTATDFNAAVGAAVENVYFWQDLRLAGFVAGDTANGDQPQNALGGIVGVQTGAGLAAAPGVSPDFGGLVVCTSNLNGKIAEAIDRQFDDGIPNKGALRAFTQSKVPVTRGGANPTRGTAAVGMPTDTPTAGPGYNASDDTELYTICKSL